MLLADFAEFKVCSLQEVERMPNNSKKNIQNKLFDSFHLIVLIIHYNICNEIEPIQIQKI